MATLYYDSGQSNAASPRIKVSYTKSGYIRVDYQLLRDGNQWAWTGYYYTWHSMPTKNYLPAWINWLETLPRPYRRLTHNEILGHVTQKGRTHE